MLVIGWQEHVDLPLLGMSRLKAKINTGGWTSALHATEIEEFMKDGAPWVRFHSRFDDDTHDAAVECPIHDRRQIKNTSGVPEERLFCKGRKQTEPSDCLATIECVVAEGRGCHPTGRLSALLGLSR